MQLKQWNDNENDHTSRKNSGIIVKMTPRVVKIVK